MSDTTNDGALDDPWLWLEDVDGERALSWVRERNAETEAVLRAQPGFDATQRRILDVLDSREQIPYVSRRGAWFYNFWRDADHVRGLWRRCTPDDYARPEPAWQTVLDLDALAAAEGENWVWGGALAFGPDYRRALVQLSRGGADAVVVREFDLVDTRFVDGGFTLPEAKTSLAWADTDTLYVATDFGPGSMTASGYARIVKRWRRGTPLSDAATVFEAEPDDVYAYGSVDRTPGHERTFFVRATDFYHHRLFHLQADGSLQEVDKPGDASVSFAGAHALVELRSDWTVAGRTWPRGSLLVTGDRDFLAGGRDFTALFTPTARRSLASWSATRSTVLLDVLEDVTSRLEAWSEGAGGWQQRAIDAPPAATLGVTALHDPLLADDPLAEAYLVTHTDFLTPDSLLLGNTAQPGLKVLKRRPAMFDATGCRTEQRFATSADGTRVPYFVVWPTGARADGANPTLLYGYGGFEVSRQPAYSGTTGRTWLERGGVYVLANLRGGGEYGPAWHQAAIRENKQKSYDDLAAIAQDLIATGVTQPARLGIQGGSNGGLLVGAVMLQRPELFNAVVCQVPLLDMRRYHRLLAGASWMAEYGNPDDPADWAFISRYSPYQNVRSEMKLPRVLLTTSTRDDRVHPAHARKMAARLREQGHDVLYWENLEGGHGGAADNAQRATKLALEDAFLWLQLGPSLR